MDLIKSARAAIAATVVFGISLSPALAKEEPKQLNIAVKALKVITESQKSGVPPALFKDVVAIALFPGVSKADFMVKGRMGRGILMAHDSEGSWGNPVFVTLSGGTLGWQVVGDPMDIILLFKNRKNIDDILKGRLALGGKSAIITEGPLGKSMKGATDEQLKADINSYVFTHGEFTEVSSIAGAALQVEAAANDAYYGKPKVNAAEVIADKVESPSAELKSLHKLLADYANRK
jgi:lipid-binding SYLF domain-containing protein